jgi:hypothetical protein
LGHFATSIPNPQGGIAVLLKPGSKDSARKSFRAQGWKIENYSVPFNVSSATENAQSLTVPVGSERRAIAQLKNLPIALDASSLIMEKAAPGYGWVLLPPGSFADTSVSAVQSEIDSLLAKTWPGKSAKLRAVARQGNTFDVVLRGPLSGFTDTPKLPGFWIDTKFQLLVETIEKGNRLLIIVRDGKLIRWPESGKGEPPAGYGTKLDCEAEGGDTKNMATVIAVANMLLKSTSQLFHGKDLSAPDC